MNEIDQATYAREQRMRERVQLANTIIERVKDKLQELVPDIPLAVHWDDHDCDARTFWVHVRCPALEKAAKGDSTVRRVSNALRTAKALATPVTRRLSYKPGWWMQDGPSTRFKQLFHRKEFDGYSTDTWIYRLTFYGGPDAVYI